MICQWRLAFEIYMPWLNSFWLFNEHNRNIDFSISSRQAPPPISPPPLPYTPVRHPCLPLLPQQPRSHGHPRHCSSSDATALLLHQGWLSCPSDDSLQFGQQARTWCVRARLFGGQPPSAERPILKWQRAKLVDQELSQLPWAPERSQVGAPAVGGAEPVGWGQRGLAHKSSNF